jgi:hypothetical protein
MKLNIEKIQNFFYITLAISVALMVAHGYGHFYTTDLQQKFALKQYEASESLLKNKLSELQTAIEILNKGGGGSENPFVSTTPVSFPVTEDVIVSSIVLGLIFFGLTMFAVSGSQNVYVKQLIKSVTTSIFHCNAARDGLNHNLIKHHQLAIDYLNALVRNMKHLRMCLYGFSGSASRPLGGDSPLCKNLDGHIELLSKFREVLEKECCFELHEHFSILLRESGLLMEQVIQPLAVLGVRNLEVDLIIKVMQEAEINFVIATTFIG